MFFVRLADEEVEIIESVRKFFRNKSKSRAFEEALRRFIVLIDEVGAFKHYALSDCPKDKPTGRNFFIPIELNDKLDSLHEKYRCPRSFIARSAIIDLGIVYGIIPQKRVVEATKNVPRPQHRYNVRVFFSDAEMRKLDEVRANLAGLPRSKLVERALQEFMRHVDQTGQFPYRHDLQSDDFRRRRVFKIEDGLADRVRAATVNYHWSFSDFVRAAVLTFLDGQAAARDDTPH